MLPIFMIQSRVFWLRGKPLRNIQPFNGFAPMQDIERLLNKMFPKNSALVLILLHARKLDGRFYLSGGSWSVLWPGSTIPAVFPKTMKCLSVLHKLFAPLLPSARCSSGFSLLVQLLKSHLPPQNFLKPVCGISVVKRKITPVFTEVISYLCLVDKKDAGSKPLQRNGFLTLWHLPRNCSPLF